MTIGNRRRALWSLVGLSLLGCRGAGSDSTPVHSPDSHQPDSGAGGTDTGGTDTGGTDTGGTDTGGSDTGTPQPDLYPPDQVPYEHSDRPTTVALPELGGSFVDPVFGTTVTRITEYDEVLWEGYPKHDYAKAQPWNLDQTLYRFSSVALYDSQTYEVVRELPNLYVATWSNTDPLVLFGFRPTERIIERYRVDTEERETLVDLTARCDAIALGPGEGNIDADDHLAAVVCRQASDLEILLVDLQGGTIEASRTLPGAWGDPTDDLTTYVDWVSVSQLGGYVVINWNHNTTSREDPFMIDGEAHFGVEVFDVVNLELQRRLWPYGDHGDLCVDTDGDEVYVQFNGPDQSYVNLYRLSDAQHVSLINEDQGPDIRADFRYHGGHISCRNTLRPGWAYLSLEYNSDLPEEYVNDGQILAVKLDGSGTVEHFTHHQSSSTTYDKSPMPVPSPDGTTVMFSSDWGASHDPDLVYEFTVRW